MRHNHEKIYYGIYVSYTSIITCAERIINLCYIQYARSKRVSTSFIRNHILVAHKRPQTAGCHLTTTPYAISSDKPLAVHIIPHPIYLGATRHQKPLAVHIQLQPELIGKYTPILLLRLNLNKH